MFRITAALIALFLTSACDAGQTVRVAAFNIAMGLEKAGQLSHALAAGDDPRLEQVAEILQRVRPEIVLLNEFDYDPTTDSADLLNNNYLGRAHNGQSPIHYPYHFRAAVNTGVDSGLDLDGDGKTGGPGDGWGFGHFPGQYGMLVLSRFPLENNRTFREFKWSAMPKALRPINPDGSSFYPDESWSQLRLSSKSHWDLAFNINGKPLHLLAHHPTPPVFDGPEDRNGRRNSDEIRFWKDYTEQGGGRFIQDDQGVKGGIAGNVPYVIAGDFNSDPHDGDSVDNAIGQLLQLSRIGQSCLPVSTGAAEAARLQGGVNEQQSGDPAADTADFNDKYTGNLRVDYVLPSSDLAVKGCGVFWPSSGEQGHDLAAVSDHHLVWIDLQW
jgi:hypothetical protein